MLIAAVNMSTTSVVNTVVNHSSSQHSRSVYGTSSVRAASSGAGSVEGAEGVCGKQVRYNILRLCVEVGALSCVVMYSRAVHRSSG